MSLSALVGALQHAGQKVVYLLRDVFATDDPAPITAPRTCEPGPGTLTVVDTASRFSVDNHKLYVGAGTTALSLTSGGIARANARGLFFDTIQSSSSSTGIKVGWTDGAGDIKYCSLNLLNSRVNGGMFINSLFQDLYDPQNVQRYFVVLRTAGAFVGGYIEGQPKLFYVETIQAQANPQVKIENYNAQDFNTLLDNLTVYDELSELDTDWGVATSRTALPASGQTGTMTVDGQVDFTWTPAGGEIVDLQVRRTDDDNCWIVRCNQAGSRIYLYEKIAGVETERGAVGGVAQTWTVGTARKITVLAEGAGLRVYTIVVAAGTGGGQVLKYTSATFNQAATGIKVSGFATGANLVAWPRSIALPGYCGVNLPKRYVASGDSKTATDGWQPGLDIAANAAGETMWLKHLNQAVSAYTAAQLKTYLDTNLPLAGYGVEKVLLNIGVNDLTAGTIEATFKTAYLGCLDAFNARWPSAKVYCTRVWARTYDETNINAWIGDCVALRPSFANLGDDESIWLEGGDNGATMTTDGIHYSAAGNAEAIVQKLPFLLA